MKKNGNKLDNLVQLLEKANADFAIRRTTWNEVRAMFGMNPVDDGDDLYVAVAQ